MQLSCLPPCSHSILQVEGMRTGWEYNYVYTTCSAQARLCYIMSENIRPTITLIWPAISTVCIHNVSVWNHGWVGCTHYVFSVRKVNFYSHINSHWILPALKEGEWHIAIVKSHCPLKLHTHYINKYHSCIIISEALNEVRIPCIFVVPTYTSFHGLIVATLVYWQSQYISSST